VARDGEHMKKGGARGGEGRSTSGTCEVARCFSASSMAATSAGPATHTRVRRGEKSAAHTLPRGLWALGSGRHGDLSMGI
jgi:hypothetical protein